MTIKAERVLRVKRNWCCVAVNCINRLTALDLRQSCQRTSNAQHPVQIEAGTVRTSQQASSFRVDTAYIIEIFQLQSKQPSGLLTWLSRVRTSPAPPYSQGLARRVSESMATNTYCSAIETSDLFTEPRLLPHAVPRSLGELSLPRFRRVFHKQPSTPSFRLSRMKMRGHRWPIFM